MSRRALAAIALVALAGCSSSSSPSTAPPTPPANVTPATNVAALRVYAETFESVAPQTDAISSSLDGCRALTRHCKGAAASAGAVALFLIHRLNADDSYREGSTEQMAPGISPLIFRSEQQARLVHKSAGALATHPGELAALSKHMKSLAGLVDAWRPGGRAAKALAAVHVALPTVAASP